MPKVKTKFYAVRVGRKPGIYSTWVNCKKQVNRYPRARHKSFRTLQEAIVFVKDGNNNKKVKLFLENSMQEISESSPKQHSIPSIPVHSLASNVNNGDLAVWTDGSSLNNGQDNARAGVGVYWGKDDPRNVSERVPGPNQTNNRAEIMAVIRALETCPDNNVTLEIRTDSKYTIDAVKNLELFQRLTKLVKSRNGEVKFQHVPGHAGVVESEEADKLAKLGSMMDAVNDFYDYGEEESDKKSKITDYFTKS